jgi:hypothetical protein
MVRTVQSAVSDEALVQSTAARAGEIAPRAPIDSNAAVISDVLLIESSLKDIDFSY